MTYLRRFALISSLATGAVLLTLPAAAIADQSNVAAAQALAQQIEGAITAAGPSATADQIKLAIESTIAASGASPAVAEAAIADVEGTSPGSTAVAALSSVDNQILAANTGNTGVPGAGGTSGGTPIAAITYSGGGGGGSDYVFH